MNIEPLDFLIHAINFCVMFLILWLLLYRPVVKFVRARAQAATKKSSEAQAMLDDARAKLDSVNNMLDSARDTASALKNEAVGDANADAARIISAARRQADEIIASARAEADEIRLREADKLRAEAVETAVTLAEKVIGREIVIEDNRRIVDEFFAERSAEHDERA